MKRALSVLLTVIMICCFTVTGFAAPSGTYTEVDNSVVVTGQLTEESAGNTVTLLLLKELGEDEYDFAHVAWATVSETGSYEFKFALTNKSNDEVESYTLRVNENDTDVTNTVLNVVADSEKVIISTPENQVLPIASTQMHTNNRVYIKGHLGEEYYGAEVSLLLIYPKGNEATKIGYAALGNVDVNGDYTFKFKFNPPSGNVNDYYVRINKAGKEVSNTLIEATASSSSMYEVNTVLTESGTTTKLSTNLLNKFGLSAEELLAEGMTSIIAYYDEAGTLVKCSTLDSDDAQINYDGEDIVFENTCTVPEGAVEAKAFLWKSLETLIPVLDAKKMTTSENIVSWGDSLTQGAGGDGITYSNYLAGETGKTVLNYGIGSESATSIAVRQGGVKLLLKEAITIPEASEAIEIKLGAGNDVDITKNLLGNEGTGGASKGLNPVTINGVKGNISRSGTVNKEDVQYFFTRLEAGDAVAAAANTQIIPNSITSGVRDDINIIFVGQNGGYPNSNVDGLISVTDAMVNNLNTDRYIIIGLTTGNALSRKSMEQAMLAHYGSKYINMREWLSSSEAIEVVGITLSLTDEDKASMKSGAVPEALLTDAVHLNSYGYKLMGMKIHERMTELGYIQ